MPDHDWSKGERSRRGEEHLFFFFAGEEVQEVINSPGRARKKKGSLSRKSWEVDEGAEADSSEPRLCVCCPFLMHAAALAPENVRKVMELTAIKRTSGSSAQRSHSSGCLHTQEEH